MVINFIVRHLGLIDRPFIFSDWHNTIYVPIQVCVRKLYVCVCVCMSYLFNLSIPHVICFSIEILAVSYFIWIHKSHSLVQFFCKEAYDELISYLSLYISIAWTFSNLNLFVCICIVSAYLFNLNKKNQFNSQQTVQNTLA